MNWIVMVLQRPFFVAGGLAFLSGSAALVARANPDVITAGNALSAIAVVSLCGAAICFGRNVSGPKEDLFDLNDAALAIAKLPQDVLFLDGKDLSLVYLNAAASERLGISAHDGFGQPIQRVLSGAPFAALRAAITDLSRATQLTDQDIPLQLGGKDMIATLSRTTAASGPIIVVLKEAATSASSSSAMVTTVSHELRSPLTSIKGSLGLMLAGSQEDLPQSIRNLAEMALRNTDKLVMLTDDILDHQKIAAGKLTLTKAPTDVSDLVQDGIATVAVQAVAANVRIVSVGADAPIWSNTDGHRVAQVLTNLLSNAIRFSPSGGTITVALSTRDDAVQLRVVDEGTGVPEGEQDKLFQPYADLTNSNRHQKGGTGLGLSISKALVEELGGQIGYASPEGHGAEFHFTLPLLTRGKVGQKFRKTGLTPAA